jgi:hypothetical protein
MHEEQERLRLAAVRAWYVYAESVLRGREDDEAFERYSDLCDAWEARKEADRVAAEG